VELDYEAAFEVYGRTAAELGAPVTCESFVSFAMTHPLGIPQADGAYVIRDPIQLEIDGALRCVGDVPAGCLVRVMRGDAEMLLAAAGEAAAAARAEVAAPLGGALVFDCVSRYLILRERVREELQRVQSRLGTGVPLMGCLTLGEIGALGHGMPQFHNKTVVLLALPG
jgi:hypothetical protein